MGSVYHTRRGGSKGLEFLAPERFFFVAELTYPLFSTIHLEGHASFTSDAPFKSKFRCLDTSWIFTMSNSTSSVFAQNRLSWVPAGWVHPFQRSTCDTGAWPICCIILASLTLPLATGIPASAQDDFEMMDEDYDMDMEDFDMDEEEMMMDDYDMMGSRGRSSRSGNVQQVLAEAQQNALFSMVANMDLSPLSASPESLGLSIEAGPELRGDAEKAYQSGNYPAALQLHFAHMVTEFEQAHAQLKTVKYSKLLRRPVWQIRWGVSYAVRGEAESSDPSPIEEGKTPRMIGGPGGFGDDMGMEEEMGMDSDMGMEEEMMAMEEEMMMDMEEEMMMDMDAGGRGRPQASPVSAPTTVTRTMLSESAKSQMDKYLGLVAKVVEEKFSERYRQGAFGPALCNVSTAPAEAEAPNGRPVREAANPTAVTSLKGPVDDLLAESPEMLPMWIPGVMFLGATDSKSALQDAKLDRIDLLLHFDITLKTNRNQQTQNISRCRLMSVSTGKPLASSKTLDSYEVAQLARAGRTGERAYVEEQVANLFTVIDNHVKAADMPKLTAEIAKRRVGTLLSASPSDRLRALAEVRLYQAQGLLNAADVETAFEIVGGQEGLAILHGPLSQKLSIAREWVIRALENSN